MRPNFDIWGSVIPDNRADNGAVLSNLESQSQRGHGSQRQSSQGDGSRGQDPQLPPLPSTIPTRMSSKCSKRSKATNTSTNTIRAFFRKPSSSDWVAITLAGLFVIVGISSIILGIVYRGRHASDPNNGWLILHFTVITYMIMLAIAGTAQLLGRKFGWSGFLWQTVLLWIVFLLSCAVSVFFSSWRAHLKS